MFLLIILPRMYFKHCSCFCSPFFPPQQHLSLMDNRSGFLTLLSCLFQSCTTTEETTMSLCLWSKTWLGRGKSHSPRRLTLNSHMWRNHMSPTLDKMSNYGELGCVCMCVYKVLHFNLSHFVFYDYYL